MTPAALKALFDAERARFRAAFPASAVGATTLHFTDAPCPARVGCKPRDYAVARWGGASAPSITFARRVLDLPRENIVALVRHELAHIADPTPDAPEAEVRADRIASQVGGESVRYDRRAVQTVARSGSLRPRPRHLHR